MKKIIKTIIAYFERRRNYKLYKRLVFKFGRSKSTSELFDILASLNTLKKHGYSKGVIWVDKEERVLKVYPIRDFETSNDYKVEVCKTTDGGQS